MNRLFFPLILLLVIGCTSEEYSTEAIEPVKNFELQRYLGVWYEIARLPNSFEKDLEQVTATYTLQDDGKIGVFNKGFNTVKGKWEEANGKAWKANESNDALLKVSFFWIISSEYKVIALDTVNYSYAMVTSSSKKYLWILSRTPQLEEPIYNELIRKANGWGFDTAKIYKVSHPQ